MRLSCYLPGICSKIQRGFAHYEANTGSAHPLAHKGELSKRAVGNDALTDDAQELWYGAISVGTPAVAYTGTSPTPLDGKP